MTDVCAHLADFTVEGETLDELITSARVIAQPFFGTTDYTFTMSPAVREKPQLPEMSYRQAEADGRPKWTAEVRAVLRADRGNRG